MRTPAKRLVRLAASLAFGLPSAAGAMQFASRPLDGGGAAIVATGPIVAGDFGRLLGAVALAGVPARVVSLDSVGGSVAEAEKLAKFVRTLHASVSVGSGATCASACFLVFAAGEQRYAFAGARIGLHSASMDGVETADAMASTIAMARAAAALGVPDAIIGKLVSTAPDRIGWLTPADLAAFGVRPMSGERTPATIAQNGASGLAIDLCAPSRRPADASAPTVFTAGCASARLMPNGS